MNISAFDSVTFLNNSIKNKLLNETIPMLEELSSKLGSRSCDDLNNEKFNAAEKVLLNMEFCKINGSIADDIKDGTFATPIGQASCLVTVAVEVLKKYLEENGGYDADE
jgi:hypothetical protein